MKTKPRTKTPAKSKARAKVKPARPTPNADGYVEMEIRLGDVNRPPTLQMRKGEMNEEHIDAMEQALREGAKLPRLRCFRITDEDGKTRIVVVDGFHRYEAYYRINLYETIVPIEIKDGSYFEALLVAAAANKEHLGLPRTHKDKRKAVERLLTALAEAKQNWTDNRIAGHVGVHHDLVKSVREATGLLADSATSRIGADGRVITEKPRISLGAVHFPPAIRDLPIKVPDALGTKLRDLLAKQKIGSIGEFLERAKAGDLDLDRLQVDTVDRLIQTEGMRRAAAATTDKALVFKAILRPMAAHLSAGALDRIAFWLREETGGGKLRIGPSDPLDVIEAAAETMPPEKILAGIVACDMFRGSKEGAKFFQAIGLAPPEAATEPSEPAKAEPAAAYPRPPLKEIKPAPLLSMLHLPADGVDRLETLRDFPANTALLLAEGKVRTVKELINALPKKTGIPFTSEESLLKDLDRTIAMVTGISADSWDVSNASEVVVRHLRASASFEPIEACGLMADALSKASTPLPKIPEADSDIVPKVKHIVLNDRPHIVFAERVAGGSIYRTRPLWTEPEAQSKGVAPMAPGDRLEGIKVQISLQGVGAVYWNDRVIGGKDQERRFVHQARKASA